MQARPKRAVLEVVAATPASMLAPTRASMLAPTRAPVMLQRPAMDPRRMGRLAIGEMITFRLPDPDLASQR